MLFVTHNLALVRSIAARVQVLNAGELVESGFVVEVLDTPKQEYTQAAARATRPRWTDAPKPASWSTLQFVNPQLAGDGLELPAGAGDATRARCRSPSGRCSWTWTSSARAGRWSLAEFHADDRERRRCWCWSTACWRTSGTRDGLGPADDVPRRLGDQVGAGAPGRRGGPVRGAGAGRPGRRRTCPSWRAPATRGCRCGTLLTHDQRRGLGGGPPRPGRPGHRAGRVRSLAGRRRRGRCWPGSARGARRAPATSTARPTRRCWTGCASAPPACRSAGRAAAAVARPGLHRRRRGGGRRRRGGAGRRRAGRRRPRLGPDRVAAGRRHGCPTAHAAARTATGSTTRSRPSLPFLRPGRLPSALSTHVGFGYHWWPLDDARRTGSAPTAAAASSSTSTARARRRRGEDLGLGLRRPGHDRQCRDLSYLALARHRRRRAGSTREGVTQ